MFHPFYDGNGRTDRILNVLYLLEQKLLTLPIFLFKSLYRSQQARLLSIAQPGHLRQTMGWLTFVYAQRGRTNSYLDMRKNRWCHGAYVRN